MFVNKNKVALIENPIFRVYYIDVLLKRFSVALSKGNILISNT